MLSQEYAENIVNSRFDTNKIQVDTFIYIGAEATKLKCTCKMCGHIWTPNYHNFTTGRVQSYPECHKDLMASKYRLIGYGFTHSCTQIKRRGLLILVKHAVIHLRLHLEKAD